MACFCCFDFFIFVVNKGKLHQN